MVKKEIYKIRYSDGFTALVSHKVRKGHRAESGQKVISVKKIKNPTRFQRFRAW